jgi:NACalpha-BTF3-like transcription factor
VSDGTSTNDLVIPFAVLVGDTNWSTSVNASDIAQTKAQGGQTVDASNFRQDVTANGSISASDISLVKSQAGASLPAVPNQVEAAKATR